MDRFHFFFAVSALRVLRFLSFSRAILEYAPVLCFEKIFLPRTFMGKNKAASTLVFLLREQVVLSMQGTTRSMSYKKRL